jgi:hypothetical protein
MKRIYQKLVAGMLLVLVVVGGFSIQGHAQESRMVETEGTVRLTGVWVDPNQPTPKPPQGELPDYEAKPPGGNRPIGNLPQTNMITQRSWLYLGLLILLFVLNRLYEKHKKNKNMKEGTY